MRHWLLTTLRGVIIALFVVSGLPATAAGFEESETSEIGDRAEIADVARAVVEPLRAVPPFQRHAAPRSAPRKFSCAHDLAPVRHPSLLSVRRLL